MCCFLVSGFLTEITQQIHSLRASGVISSHFARAIASESRAFCKSAGTRCTAPGEVAFLVMNFILHRLCPEPRIRCLCICTTLLHLYHENVLEVGSYGLQLLDNALSLRDNYSLVE